MLKRLLSIMILIWVALPVLSQNLVSTFMLDLDKDDRKGIIQVNVSGTMLRHAAKNDPEVDKELRKLFENIDGISIIIGIPMDGKLKKKLDAQLTAYKELMQVIEEDQSIMMYTKETKKQIDEFVLCVLTGDQATLMSIKGKIDLKQISRLSESLKIEGIEHLHRLKN